MTLKTGRKQGRPAGRTKPKEAQPLGPPPEKGPPTLRFLSRTPRFSIQVRAAQRTEANKPFILEGQPGGPVYVRFDDYNRFVLHGGETPEELYYEKFAALTNPREFSPQPGQGTQIWPDPTDMRWVKTGLFTATKHVDPQILPLQKALDADAIGKSAFEMKEKFAAKTEPAAIKPGEGFLGPIEPGNPDGSIGPLG